VRHGLNGRILHVGVAEGKREGEKPSDAFYRKDAGGSAMGAYFLLAHTLPAADPLGP
jgi:aldehyde:ferredoxin oxidoreductase